MKNKKLWIGLAALAVLLVAVLLLAHSCGQGTADPTDPSQSETPSDTLPDSQPGVEITLNQSQAMIGVGGTLWLKAETKNTQEAVVWASSAPEIAEVREGEVTGLKEGTAVISACVGSARAECIVTVSSDAPTLTVNERYVVLSVGDSYTLQAQVTLRGEPYTEAPVTYQWTAEAGEEYVSLQPSADGSTATVTGLAFGDAQFYVSTQVGGVSLTKKVQVVCCDTGIVMNADGTGIQPTVGGFTLSLELGKSVRPQVTVYNNDEPVRNPRLSWSTDKPDVVEVSTNGNITGLKEGSAVVTVRYGDRNNTLRIYVNVYRPVYNRNTHYIIETAVGTLTLTDQLEGNITDVSLNGRSVLGSLSGNTVTFKPGTLPVDAAVMGEGRPLVVDTDRAKYIYSASVYSKIITTAQEFKDMATFLARRQGDNNWAKYTGYIILGNDIDLQGEAFELFPGEAWSDGATGTDMKAAMGFNGVFDGCGYTVSNYTATAGNNALFSYLGSGGVIRNVSITDITAPATTGNIVTRVINGKIQNVYISIKSWDNGAVLAHSYRDGRYLHNVMIEYTGPQIDGTRDVVGHWGTPPNYFVHYPPNISNVYVVGNITELVTNCAEHGTQQSCGFHTYKNMAQMKAAGNSYSAFPRSFWNLDSGLPIPHAVYQQRSGVDITITNTETILSAGDQVTLCANVEYVTWTLESAPAGVSLQGNVLTVTENAALGDIQVTATNVYNSKKTDSSTFQVVDMSRQTLADLGDLELNDTKGQTTVTLDLSQATAFTEVAGIKIGDKEISVESCSGSTVTIATQELKPFLGKDVEMILTCKVSGGYNKVTLSATVVSKVIETAAEFKAMADFMDRTEGDNNWAQYTGFLVLGKDIDLAGAAFEMFTAEAWSGTGGSDMKIRMGFNGTLDGRGYAVSGYTATAGNNALFSYLGVDALIRNISFVDITAPAGTGNILTRVFNGKLQDVYISLAQWREGNLLCHPYRDGRFLENVVIEYTGAPIEGLRDITGHWGEANYYVHYPNNIKNVYILGDIETIQTNCAEHGADIVCGFHTYKTLAEMQAAGNSYSGFSADIWNTSSGIPVPVKLFNKWSSTDITVTNTMVEGQYELIKGSFMELTANVPYVTWELVGNTDPKVTLEGSKLSAQKDAQAQAVTVKATNRYNSSKSVQISVKLVSSAEKTLEKLPYLELLGQTHATVALQESQTVTAILGVNINGKAVPAEGFGLENGSLKLAVEQLEEYCGKAVTLEISYKAAGTNVIATCPVELVVSKAVKTFGDLQYLNAVTTPDLNGYFILANSIDAAGQSIAAGSTWGNGFQGIFDGCGYTISNLTLGDGAQYAGIFGAVSGGTIRNITFDNVVYNSRAGLFGRVLSNKAGTNQKTTVENVTVNVSNWAAGATETGLFSYTILANTVFTDVTVNIGNGITVANLLGNSFNADNVEGEIVVNLGAGSTIVLFHDSSAVKPDVVTLNKANSVTIDTEIIAEAGILKLTHSDWTTGTAQVTVSGTTKNAVITDGAIQVNLADFGAAYGKLDSVVVTVGRNAYTYTGVLHVTQIIDNVAELKALGTACKDSVVTGYYILGADIDCSGEANMANGSGNATTNGFSGTFDGRGKTISNITLSGAYGGLFGKLLGATIKDTVFDNVKLGTNGSLLAVGADKNSTTNVVTSLQDLTINLSEYATGYGAIVGYSMFNTVGSGIVINVADGLTITSLLARDTCNSIGYITATVNLGVGSTITKYYSNITAKPETFTVNTSRAPVDETLDTLVAAEGTTTVTFTHEALAAGNASVTINDQTMTVEASAGAITVDLQAFGVSSMGQYSVLITQGVNKLTYTEVWYVTQVIDTVDELKALGAACKAANTTGYYILGADIDCSGEANMAAGVGGWQANGFSGTFDGRGKTISNIKMMYDAATGGYGGLFGNLAGCTIQNVVFDKVNYSSTNVALLGRHSYASGGNNVNLKNLTINVSGWGATGTSEAGVLLSKNMQNTITTNVTVNVANGLTINTLLGADCSSIAYVTLTVNLGAGSSITNYYGTTTVKPDTITVNAPSEPVTETLSTLVAGEGTTAVTFENGAFALGNASVTINEQTKSVTITEAGKLTVDLASFGVTTMGQYSAVIVVGESQLTYNQVWYVTQVIDTVAELKALGTSCKDSVVTGYYILGGDINCSAEATMSNGSPSTTTNGFSGTFDGRGKTISNIKMTWDSATSGLGGLFGKLLGATIKDTVFDNVNLGTNGTLLASGADKNSSTNTNTTLRNLTINLNGYSTVYGVVVGYSMFNTVGSGIVINVADGLTVAALMCRDTCNSIDYITATVNLGTGSTITYYYGTTATKPSTITVN